MSPWLVASLHQCLTGHSLPGAQENITLDKFHDVKYLGVADDRVRRLERKALVSEACEGLKSSKYGWLYNPKNMARERKLRFKAPGDIS